MSSYEPVSASRAVNLLPPGLPIARSFAKYVGLFTDIARDCVAGQAIPYLPDRVVGAGAALVADARDLGAHLRYGGENGNDGSEHCHQPGRGALRSGGISASSG